MVDIKPMSKVPARTLVDVFITVPGIGRQGFRWAAPIEMSAITARREIGRDLFTQFLDAFVPLPSNPQSDQEG